MADAAEQLWARTTDDARFEICRSEVPIATASTASYRADIFAWGAAHKVPV